MIEVAIRIPDDLRRFVEESVKAGAFNDAGDFVVNLLYAIKAQNEVGLSGEQEASLATLRAEIDVGIDQIERGDFVDFNANEIIAAGRERRDASVAG